MFSNLQRSLLNVRSVVVRMAGVHMVQFSPGGLWVSLDVPVTLMVHIDDHSRLRRGRVDWALGLTAVAVSLAKGPAEAFDRLKAVLEFISIIYAKYQIYSSVLFKPFLTITSPEHHCHRGQL